MPSEARRRLAALALCAALSLASAAHAAPPEVVSDEDIASHLTDLSQNPFILDEESRLHISGLRVDLEVIIDETGRVTEATPRWKSPDYRDAAIRLALSLRFEPFVFEGLPASVTGVLTIPVYTMRLPAADSGFPDPLPADAEIRLERSECFGPCPAYRISIHRDGKTVFEGFRNVFVIGRIEEAGSPAAFTALLEQFRQARFMNLDDGYILPVLHAPAVTLTLRLGSTEKKIVDYRGLKAGMPPVIAELEQAVDDFARSVRWTRGTATVVKDLKGIGWDFNAPASADILACAVELGDAAVIRELLRAGVRADGRCRDYDTTAFEVALQSNRLDVAKDLLAAGALERAPVEARRKAVFDAVRLGRPDLLRAVLEAGGNVDGRDEQGRTPLALVRPLAFPAKPPNSPEAEASMIDHRAMLLLLEAAGANP